MMFAVPAGSRSTTWVSNSDGKILLKVLAFILIPTETISSAPQTYAVCADGTWRRVGHQPDDGQIIL